MSRSQSMRTLAADLAVTKARLRAAEMRIAELTGEAPAEAMVPAWAEGLTASESYLVLGLAKAYPRWLSMWALENAVPSFDRNREREANTVSVLICRVRKKLGHDAIETKTGFRRLSDTAHLRLFGDGEPRQRSPSPIRQEARPAGEIGPPARQADREERLADFASTGKTGRPVA